MADWTAIVSATRPCPRARLLAIALGHPKCGKAVGESLVAAAEGRHAIAHLTEMHILALLSSPAAGHRELVGKLLLQAGIEEGLRQAIIRSIDRSPLAARIYMKHLILDNDLLKTISMM